MENTYTYLKILVVVAFVAALAAARASADPCSHVYVGLEVDYSEEGFSVSVWLKPIEASWQYFKEYCLSRNKDAYTGLMRNIAAAALQVRGSMDYLTIVDDEAEEIMFLADINERSVGTFSSSGNSVRLVVYDPLYIFGHGYLDEIHIVIPVKATHVFPSNYYVEQESGIYIYSWYRRSLGEAGSYVAVEFSLRSLEIHVNGLPQSYSVKVYVDGNYLGTVSGGGSLTAALPPGKDKVSVDVYPREIEAGDGVKYVAEAPVDAEVEEYGEVDIVYRRYYRVQISLEPAERVSSLRVTVDGSTYTGGFDGYFEEGSSIHVSVDTYEYVGAGPGRRRVYTFSSWSDGSTDPDRTIVVDRPIRLEARYSYKVQYFVEAGANVAGVTVEGGGWYDEGDVAVLSAPVRVDRDGYRYLFRGWSGGGENNVVRVVVDSPLTVTALYEEYVFVDASTGCGEVEGAGYYKVGSEVTLRLRGLEEGGLCWTGSFYTKLKGWRVGGELYPASEEVSFRAERPVTVKPVFEGKYYRVRIGGEERILPEGYSLPVLGDKRLLGGLVVERFVGYRRTDTGEFIGRSPSVRENMNVEPVYVADYTYLAVLLVVVTALTAGFYMTVARGRGRRLEERGTSSTGGESYAVAAVPVEASAGGKGEGAQREAGGFAETGTLSPLSEGGGEGDRGEAEKSGANRGGGVVEGGAGAPLGLPLVDTGAIMFLGSSGPREAGAVERHGGYECSGFLGPGDSTLFCVKEGERYVLKRVKGEAGEDAVREILSVRATGVEPYLELVDGMLVRRYIPAPPLELAVDVERREALKVALSVALSLEDLHRSGVVHGGVKPANIFVVEGRVALVDHGYYRFSSGKESPFDPPEGVVDEKSDVYMLGALTYWLLTMKEPSEFDRGDLEEYGRLADVVERSLSRDVGARPSLSEFIDALRGVVDG